MSTPDPTAIDHWHRLDPRLTSSGQPTEAEFPLIAALGVRHIINLGLPDHPRAVPNEAASVASLGLTYSAIPVEFGAPTEADFAQFCTLMDRHDGEKLHIHCIANYRVSAFLYRYRRKILGWSHAASLPDLRAIWEPDPVWATFIALDPDIGTTT